MATKDPAKQTQPSGSFFDDPADDIKVPRGPVRMVSQEAYDRVVAERDEARREVERLRRAVHGSAP